MLSLKFVDKLIPVVVQDTNSHDVLMVAYANRDAVDLTVKTGFAHYYSRSRKKIWKKGEESGHIQRVLRILVDCDEDCLIYEIEQIGVLVIPVIEVVSIELSMEKSFQKKCLIRIKYINRKS